MKKMLNVKIYEGSCGGYAVVSDIRGKTVFDLYGVDQEFLDDYCNGVNILQLMGNGFDGWDSVADKDGEDAQNNVIEWLEGDSSEEPEPPVLAAEYSFYGFSIKLKVLHWPSQCNIETMFSRLFGENN